MHGNQENNLITDYKRFQIYKCSHNAHYFMTNSNDRYVLAKPSEGAI